MNIIESLLKNVTLRSSEKSKELFLDKFLASRFAKELSKPLMTNLGKDKYKIFDFDQLPYNKISELSLENNSINQVSIEFKQNILGKLNNLEEAFEVFVSFCAHSNPLGDFRKYSDFYHNLYCTSRYVFFHGDGNCVTLGVLLYCFLEKYFKPNSIELHYACGLEREFMHVYASSLNSKTKYYVDPDQKIFCAYDLLDSNYSPGLIYQLLSAGGFHVYDKIPEQKRKILFFEMTQEIMDEYRVIPGPIIYRSHPHQANFSNLFSHARKVNSQSLDIYADDFAWKSSYKEIGRSFYSTDLPLLSRLEKSATLTIPPGGSATIGLTDFLPIEIETMCLIFFGRVPLTLTWEALPNQPQLITLPEIPWMILFEPHTDALHFQGKKVQLNKTICGRYSYLGMGDLEKIIPLSVSEINLYMELTSKSKINIIIPFNALGLNANVIDILSDNSKDLEITYRA